MSEPERWTVATVHPDMWIDPDDDPRDVDEVLTDERSTLLSYLRHFRLTLELKCADLDAEQMARRSVPPSTLSLLGIVRHLAEAERAWFRRVLAGEDAPRQFSTPERRTAAVEDAVADPEMVSAAWQAWHEEIAYADAFIAASPDLDRTGTMPDGHVVQLREVIVHMIVEYARHCGHADLLRECIDGRVGQ